MAYTTIEEVRALSRLSETDVSDLNLQTIIDNSSAQVNSRVNVKVSREKVTYVDEVRQNNIDGSNDTFYVQNWENKFISDANDDYEVTTTDVVVHQVIDNVETVLTVSSVTSDEGKFILSSAPESSSTLYVTYQYSSFDMETPDTLIGMATTYLAIAYGYLKKDAGVPTNVKFSSISISRKLSDSYGVYMDRYNLLIQEINSKSVIGGFVAESEVKI